MCVTGVLYCKLCYIDIVKLKLCTVAHIFWLVIL